MLTKHVLYQLSYSSLSSTAVLYQTFFRLSSPFSKILVFLLFSAGQAAYFAAAEVKISKKRSARAEKEDVLCWSRGVKARSSA